MDINNTMEGKKLTIEIKGRLDTSTAPQLESNIKDNIENIEELIIDMKDLVYISSAGLRIILATQKYMNKQGNMIIKNVCEDIMEIFEVTGFSDILTIQ